MVLAYKRDGDFQSFGKLELIKEELAYFKRSDARKHLLFPHKPSWRNSAVIGARRAPFFISTEDKSGDRVVKLHQDGGSSGKPLSRFAAKLTRTVLSATNAAESPTALLARNEMRSWRLLQLEPSSLRKPDEFTSPTTLETDGSHLAATLYHLALGNGNDKTGSKFGNGGPSQDLWANCQQIVRTY